MSRCLFVLTIVLFLLPLGTTEAAVVTWLGTAGDGDWNTAGNWDTMGIPAGGDTVVIANGDTVTAPTNNLPSSLIINLTGNSTLTRPNSVIRLNNATINVAAGSGLTGNGFWDLQNADFVFEDGSIVTAANWELKGQNTFTFNVGPTGFTPLTPGTFRNDGNNSASPATLIADDTFTVDLANYTGGTGVITLMDFAVDAEGLDDAAFQNATLNVINTGNLAGSLRWNDIEHSIELNLTAAPEPGSLALLSTAAIGAVWYRRRRSAKK